MSTIYGRPLFIGGGNPKVPEIFGTGADGDLYIAAGETVTLPVPVPHQSVVEMNYTSITIEAGGILTTADYNAGLVLRCQGDCTIHGTIDQSGKAPKTNPNSTYPYPAELQCGDGGNGGKGGGGNRDYTGGPGGTAMSARPYGGGYGAGGGGGGCGASSLNGGDGGGSNNINLETPDLELFAGGAPGSSGNGGNGQNGGGGAGAGYHNGDPNGAGPGGTGAGAQGGNYPYKDSGAGGGAGNTGGGVVLLFVGGNFTLDGVIDCSGKAGGNGGRGYYWGSGGGGGGGGGGSIYIEHIGAKTITGNLNISGGTGGNGGVSANPSESWVNGSPGTAGGIGTATVKQYEETA